MSGVDLIESDVSGNEYMKKIMSIVVMLIVVTFTATAQVITSMGMEDGHGVIYLSNGQKVDARLIPESHRLRVGETIQWGQMRTAADDYAREAAKYQLPVVGGWYGGYGSAGISVGNKHAGFSIGLPVGYPGYGAGVGVRIGSFHFNGNLPVFLLKKDSTKQNSKRQAQPKAQQRQSVKVQTAPSTQSQSQQEVIRVNGRDTVVRGEVNLNDLLRNK